MMEIDLGDIADIVSDSQPPTQPLNPPDEEKEEKEKSSATESIPVVEEKESGFDQDTWAVLYPIRFLLKPIYLRKSLTTIGKSSKMDHTFMREEVPTEMWNYLSSCQCIVAKPKEGFTQGVIVDKSTNGTSLTKEPKEPGKKDKKWIVAHNDIIYLTETPCYVFVYTEASRYEKFPKEIREKYLVSRFLGSGTSGDVRLSFRKTDGQRFAIKFINQTKLHDSRSKAAYDTILNEVKAYNEVKHPCIVRMEEVFSLPIMITDENGKQRDSGEKQMCLVLEYADRADFFNRITTGSVPEDECRYYFVQALKALDYLHKNKWTHRDLKPENLLLCNTFEKYKSTGKYILKIADFGLAKKADDMNPLKTFVGTPVYLAPEILVVKFRPYRFYTSAVDMWALGCSLFTALVGEYPFDRDGKSEKTLPEQIMDCDYKPPIVEKTQKRVSKEAEDLISKLIHFNPKTRLTAEQALAHPWIQKDQKTYNEALAIMESVDMMARNQDVKEEQTVDKAKSVPDVPQAKKRKQSESEEFEFAASSADENAPMNQPTTKKKRCDNN